MKNKLEFANLIESFWMIFPISKFLEFPEFFEQTRIVSNEPKRSILGVLNVLERIKPLRNEFNSVL